MDKQPDGSLSLSQEELDSLIQSAVAKAVQTTEENFAGFDELKAKASELDSLKEAHAALTAELTPLKESAGTLSAENLRLKIAVTKGLPAQLIDRLRGDNQEELEADADSLLSLVQSNAQAMDFGGGIRGGGTSADDMNSRIRRAAGRE